MINSPAMSTGGASVDGAPVTVNGTSVTSSSLSSLCSEASTSSVAGATGQGSGNSSEHGIGYGSNSVVAGHDAMDVNEATNGMQDLHVRRGSQVPPVILGRDVSDGFADSSAVSDDLPIVGVQKAIDALGARLSSLSVKMIIERGPEGDAVRAAYDEANGDLVRLTATLERLKQVPVYRAQLDAAASRVKHSFSSTVVPSNLPYFQWVNEVSDVKKTVFFLMSPRV